MLGGNENLFVKVKVDILICILELELECWFWDKYNMVKNYYLWI